MPILGKGGQSVHETGVTYIFSCCRAAPSHRVPIFLWLFLHSLLSLYLLTPAPKIDCRMQEWLWLCVVLKLKYIRGRGPHFMMGSFFLPSSSWVHFCCIFFCSLYVCVPCVIFFFSSSLFHIYTYVTRLFPRVVRSCRILLPNFGHSTNRGQRLPVVHHNEEKKIDWP